MWEFKFYSRGGQGAVTAAKLIVDAAIIDGKFAQAIPSYGQERKGAPVYAFARIDDNHIDVKSYVYRPNCVAVFDVSLPQLGINIYEGIAEGAVLVANATGRSLLPGHEKIGKTAILDADAVTREIIGDVPPNAAMLGAIAKATGCVSIEALQTAIVRKIPGKAGEKNAETCRRAFANTCINEKT